MTSITLKDPVLVQPEVRTAEIQIDRIVWRPQERLWRIFLFAQGLRIPHIEIKEDEDGFELFPVFDEDKLAAAISASIEASRDQIKTIPFRRVQ